MRSAIRTSNPPGIGRPYGLPDRIREISSRSLEDLIMDQLTAITLRLIDREPRIFDMDLGERLGYSRPDQIRRLVHTYLDELKALGSLTQGDRDGSTVYRGGTRTPFVPSRGNPSEGFWLNKAQAILISVVSDAPNAPDVRRHVIRGFLAWERGEVKSHRWPRIPSSASADPWLPIIERELDGHRGSLVLCREVRECVAKGADQLAARERQEVYRRVGYIIRLLGWRRVHARCLGRLSYCYQRDVIDLGQLQLSYG